MNGSAERSKEYRREALLLCRDLGDMPGVATSLEGVAVLAQSSGRLEKAARLFAAADVVRRDFRCPPSPTQLRDRNLRVAALGKALGQATFDAIWRAGVLMSTADAVSCAVADQADS